MKNLLSKILLVATAALFILSAVSFADFGPTRTKRERSEQETRQQTSSGNAAYERIVESFLRDEYASVDRLAQRYPQNAPKIEDVLYLQALSLLKLGRAPEARQKLKELEISSLSLNGKASASASIADSYYYEGNFPKAYESYKQSLSRYPKSDQNEYVGQRIAEIFPKIRGSITMPAVLHQAGMEEAALFSVQVGSFTKDKNAENLASKLKASHFDAYVHKTSRDRMYRVRVGRFDTRNRAEELETRLKKEGYPTRIYP